MYERLTMTENQMKVYNFVWQYQNHYKLAPTYVEIGSACGMYHTSNIYLVCIELMKKKVFRKTGKPNQPRQIEAIKNVRWIDDEVKHKFSD